MELTDDVRRAVAAEQCAQLGHEFGTHTAFTGDGLRPDGNGPIMVLNTRANTSPHILCLRCGTVWMVIEDGHPDYTTAETALIGSLADPDGPAASLRARRDRRTGAEPDPEEQPDPGALD